MHILPLLSDPKSTPLRESLTPELIALISEGMQDMQTNLHSKIISGGDTDDLDIKIQAFGQALINTWAFPLLSQDLQNLLNSWPSKADIHALHWLRIGVENEPALREKVGDYCVSLLIKAGSVASPTEKMVRSLMGVWSSVQADHNSDLRFVALNVAKETEFGSRSQCQCLDELPSLDPSFWKSMRDVIVKGDIDADAACIDMARLLAQTPESSATQHWRLILYNNVYQREESFLEYTLKRLNAAEWIQFVTDLSTSCSTLDIQLAGPLVFMTADLQAWIPRLTKYISTLSKLEQDLPKSDATSVIRRFLLGAQQQDSFENILRVLAKSYNGLPKRAMLTVISQLNAAGTNAEAISDVLWHLSTSSKQGLDSCLRLVDLNSKMSTKIVANAFLASWLQPNIMNTLDQNMLRALAKMLEINLGPRDEPSIESLKATADYLDVQFAELFLEAQRLEGLRLAYKKADPSGTSQLLSDIGVQDPSPMDDLLANLPPSLVGIIEKVEDDIVEMQFPLKLTGIQQIALGVGNAHSLVLRLTMHHLNAASFCMHLDNEKTPTSKRCHERWNPVAAQSVPDNPPCYGRANRLTYQLTRVVSRHLQVNSSSLEQIHKLVTIAMKDLNRSCLVCGTLKSTQLRRSTTCQRGCSIMYRLAPLDVRLAEIRNDPATMDLLLTTVHYAAASRKINLLPNCNFASTQQVAQALASVPALSTLQNVSSLRWALHYLGGCHTEKLLSWTCLNYRGFLVSATGKMRIPGLPADTQQFLLASAAPELEAAFLARMGNGTSRVLWHGTAMERLYAILCEGLKICSGTALQIHGAASGAGIYTAEEPVTAWGYSATPSTANWAGSSFRNVRVLLGLEAAGPAVGTGIQLVKDPSTLIVRYVFLIPSNAAMPAAANVAPAMLSAYKSLRAGIL